MSISGYQRANLKKFIRSGNYILDCKELRIPTTNVTKALATKDSEFFFSIYDKLVQKGWITDEDRRLKLPNGIDDEIEIIPGPSIPESIAPSLITRPSHAVKPEPSLPPQKIAPLESKKPKVRYNLLIDEEILERLKTESLAVDRSVSSLIRISIINYLDKKRPSK